MGDERQITLHLGSHKTGTTSIQRALFLSKPLLKSQNISLFNFELDGTERENGNALPWVNFERDGRIEGSIHPELASELGKMPGHVIISAEHFSWIFDPQIIQSFYDQLKENFDRIRLIVYLRRQDRQAISHYQQGSKKGGRPAFTYYEGSARALPEYKQHFQHYLNYHQKIGRWADVFGDENISIRVFEKEQLVEGDAVRDFFRAAGILGAPPSSRENKSDGFQRTKIGHLMRKVGILGGLYTLLRESLDNTGKLMPARKEAEAFYSHFRESNLLLNSRFKVNIAPHIFADDFDMYPAEAEDVWTEDSANQAIKNLLTGIASLSVLTQPEVDRLQISAMNLADVDAERARELVEVISKYRPGFSIDREAVPVPAWRLFLRRVRNRLTRILRAH